MPDVLDEEFVDFMTDAASWSGGVGCEWEGDALISGPFYNSLVDLIEEFVPPEKIREFVAGWKSIG